MLFQYGSDDDDAVEVWKIGNDAYARVCRWFEMKIE